MTTSIIIAEKEARMASTERMNVIVMRSDKEFGSVTWELPRETWALLETLPEDVRPSVLELVGKTLSLCATTICIELQYSIPKGELLLPSIIDAMTSVQSTLQAKISENEHPSKKELH